jgi:hypothetical protein
MPVTQDSKTDNNPKADSSRVVASTVAVFYVGGPLGGQQHVHQVGGQAGELPATREAHGGSYALEQAEGHTDLYVWTPDAQRPDQTPGDGDEASTWLDANGGATPVLDQDVTSSTTIASSEAPARDIAAEQTKGPKLPASKAGTDDSTSPRTVTDAKGTSRPAGSAAKG